MADHEVYIAEYYLKRGAYVASSERAKYMLETYPGAPASKNALLVLIASYNKLGLTDLAEESAEVLIANFSSYSYEISDNNQVILYDEENVEPVDDKSSFFGLGLFWPTNFQEFCRPVSDPFYEDYFFGYLDTSLYS